MKSRSAGAMLLSLSLVASIAYAACGGGSGASKKSTAGPAERTPDAPQPPCEGVPVLGTDLSFAEITDGVPVAIDAVPVVGAKTCTEMGCGDNACCNRCTGAYTVTVVGDNRAATAIELEGLEGCTGTECGVDCMPFGRTPTVRYRFVGELVPGATRSGLNYKLEVEAFCDAPPEQEGTGDSQGPPDDADSDADDEDMTDEELENAIEDLTGDDE